METQAIMTGIAVLKNNCSFKLQVNIFYRRLHMSPTRQREHFDPVGSALPPQFHQDSSVGL